ncbi:hypothetical protein EYR36_005752 [Pleurotus pulmonarius]|nr:hypothetical protein EYR36_003903 [Pleurotus pulmonarius]KAF4574417.1 hypothetical protein EYR36_005752 [Pleurotus pulmonarius]
MDTAAGESILCFVDACGHVLCLDCILRVITTTRRCPFACTEIASILDVSALSLCFESTSKLEPTLAPTFVNRRAQELACEFAEKKLTRDAGFARVKELEQQISWQLKNIQTYAEALSSMTSKNAGLVKELNEMKVVNNAQSVDRGVSRVRLSLMKTEKQAIFLQLREQQASFKVEQAIIS